MTQNSMTQKSMTPALLDIRGVGKAFGGNRVLEDVNISVGAGEIVGLLGPNGSGKSTLLNLVTGFARPDRGQITIGDTAIGGLPTHRIIDHGVARTFQLPSMPRKMSVIEVAMAANTAQHGFWSSRLGTPAYRAAEEATRARAEQLLKDLLLGHVRDLAAASLSGGQKKLLGIACALMREPRLLMLDEPTAGVHPNLRQDIIRALRGLNAAGMTLVVVEHDMHFIRELCNRCVVLDRGHIVADCAPRDLANHPAVLDAYLGKSARPELEAA